MEQTYSKNVLARTSGALYLVLILTGVFGLVYVPSTVVVWDNPARTVANIRAAEMLFRLGVLSQIVCFISFILMAFTLYQLLESVGKKIAATMVVCVAITIPIAIINTVNYVEILSLLKDAEKLSPVSSAQIASQVMLLFTSFNNTVVVSNIFWGMWLFPLGYLIFKSGFLPRVLGVLLMAGCFAYFAEFALRFLFTVKDMPWYVSLPSSLGEFGICLWLLIVGVNDKKGLAVPDPGQHRQSLGPVEQ